MKGLYQSLGEDNNKMNSSEILLNLVRLGIGNYSNELPLDIDWQSIQVIAKQQGLMGVIIDGIERLPDSKRPPKDMLLELIGEVLQGYEYRYESCKRTIGEMAAFYNSHGLKMMVLKGFTCGLAWPKPEHRPVGDIDIWLFGSQKEADALLKSEKSIKVNNTHHHHSIFYWNDFMVENHYDFINVYHHKSNVELEKLFKKLGQDDSIFVDVNGEKVYIPSQNLHALFLLKHAINDFTSFSVSLRQLLDWAFYVKKYSNEIDWNWLIGVLNQFHMMDFFNIINAICVENLGFDTRLFPTVQFKPELKDRVLNDILNPKFLAIEPNRLLPRLAYKYRRWQGNGWKHELCYNESMSSAFWSGVWSHVLKPSSF